MRCSTPKPFEKNPAALKTATVGGSGLFAPPGIDPAKDWQCTCGNWNFSRREKCHKCGAKKDVARGGGTKRPGEGGGYREFDEAGEERRKRRKEKRKERRRNDSDSDSGGRRRRDRERTKQRRGRADASLTLSAADTASRTLWESEPVLFEDRSDAGQSGEQGGELSAFQQQCDPGDERQAHVVGQYPETHDQADFPAAEHLTAQLELLWV